MEKEIKRPTEHITFRIRKDTLTTLKSISNAEQLSLNTYVNQILDSHLNWDVHAAQVGWVVMLKAGLVELIKKVDRQTIEKIAKETAERGAKEISLFMRGKFGVDEWISIIKDRAKMSGFEIKEYQEENNISLVMHHEMGENWSLFFSKYNETVFNELGIGVTSEITENSIVIKIGPRSFRNQFNIQNF